jgi:hypothetical protein
METVKGRSERRHMAQTRMDEAPADSSATAPEYVTWHVYDAGGPRLLLKVRYIDDDEVAGWRHGPSLNTALDQAEAQGWQAYDREPGNAQDEYAILHLKREGPAGRPLP